MKKILFCLSLVSASLLFSATLPVSSNELGPGDILGTWQRASDGLTLHFQGNVLDEQGGFTAISRLGKFNFPCNTSDSKPFYKDIQWDEESQSWTCSFLVYSMGDCSTRYIDRGKINLLEDGSLEILCPGPTFDNHYFQRLAPRYER